jgi:hypothetical protein
MSPLAALVAQEPWWGEQHWVGPDGDEQMEEINVIFRGSICDIPALKNMVSPN